ncbi:MAG TPA: peptidylprolyl isomerase [Polyangiaceae bacterium]|jgi:cyclophilin family peptidyl-prolyl cis-trans isomerase|nr:MAG: Peptidyl-prolyl cis-trans isomerase B [Deltaproteobacteria bacterium ADurb.Bin207]HNS98028.1 peptidylprolyl isomerase [Polyangiaceae bacterium]HNZ20743.1 peptidylprolyl isomerase [Polyangiaceae bacterium]HOD20642.1 peptidylprolyl isomerase [Polyangiaceae bacterium]HOE49160.1 peptidylprolyl isomerase [Polyangiaceae bacterium]
MRTLFASFFIASFGFFGCSTSEDSTQRDAETTHDAATDMAPPDAKPDSHADVTPDQNVSPDVSPDVPAESSEPSLFATIVTSKGTIRVKLADDASPITVENFQRYADAQFFDGLIFHRVIAGFMIQGGGMEPGMKTRAPLFPPIVNEASASGLSNLRGTIAMARTNQPDSATSQFFINTVDNTFLDPGQSSPAGYAVFGNVVEGMDIVDEIEAVATHTVGIYEDVPVEDVVIESLRVTTEP